MSFFDLFKRQSGREGFWEWFASNEDRIFNFENDQDTIFSELTARLRSIHPSLTFEISRIEDGKREFVLSADGDRRAFPFVESTYSKAPVLDRWTFVKFRPRIGTGLVIEFEGGFKLSPDDLKFALAKHEGKIAIGIFAKDYSENEHDNFLRAVFVLLDTALGEYDMETKVGFIDLKSWNDLDELDIEGQQFTSLPEVFDRAWAASFN